MRYRSYFHATEYSNLETILKDGLNVNSYDGCIYFCESIEDCLKFMALRNYNEIAVIKVKFYDNELIETFDHSFEFFKCRCFAHKHRIQPSRLNVAGLYKQK